MARLVYFEETDDSRDGSARGVSGVNEVRKFRMILEIDEEERSTVRYPDPRGFAEAEIPFGTPHPWNAYSFAADYLALTKEGPNRWIVGIIYKPAHAISDMPVSPAGSPWRLRLRGVSFQRELRETHAHPDDRDRSTKLIATSHFEEVDVAPGASADFVAHVTRADAHGALRPVTINLQKSGLLNPTPQTDETGGLSAIWTRTINAFDFSNMHKINNVYRHVNLREFLGAPPGHVLFDVFTLDPIDSIALGARESGRRHRVVLGFTMSVQAYTPLEMTPTVRDDRGNEAPVLMRNGRLVVEDFLHKRLARFDPVFEVFGQLPV